VTPFRRLWLAQTVSLLGDFLALFAVQVAIVFRMHGNASDIASVFLASLAPSVVLGPVAGMFADRWDPRRTMIASDVARGVLVLLLACALTVPQVCAISFAVSCFSNFFAPARAITLPLLVPPGLLLEANARMQQSMQVVRIACPALAAALVAAFGERICYAVDSATFLGSALLLATLCYSQPAQRSLRRAVLRDLGAGFRFVFADPRFSFVVFSMAAGTFAAGCFGALASVYVRDVLHRGPPLLGMIGMLIAAGTLTGSALLSSAVEGRRDPRTSIGGGMAAVGASILLIAAEPTQAATLIGSAGIGLGVAVVVVAAAAMLQGETPPELRGRVNAAAAALASLAQVAAMLLSGMWATHLGIRGVFALSAALLFAIGACGLLRSPTKCPMIAPRTLHATTRTEPQESRAFRPHVSRILVRGRPDIAGRGDLWPGPATRLVGRSADLRRPVGYRVDV
jgi:MFS family permease